VLSLIEAITTTNLVLTSTFVIAKITSMVIEVSLMSTLINVHHFDSL
jgi:hypothetical protein